MVDFGLPLISVVIVSDYLSDGAAESSDLAATLGALACQDFDGSVEVLLVESDEDQDACHRNFLAILPSLRLERSRGTGSYDMKNQGARTARGQIIVLLDADCRPAIDWLRNIARTLRDRPEVDVVSGRTLYAETGVVARVLALLSRSYVDRGISGATRHISNNNAAFRRETLLAHPLPTNAGPFASRVQAEAILRAGGCLFFEPSIRVIHRFDGWAMERDLRRNMGYGAIKVRHLDRTLPHAWIAHLGILSVPLYSAARTLASLRNTLLFGRHYGVRWFELPLAWGLAVVVHLMEVPGMVAALRGREIERTAYR